MSLHRRCDGCGSSLQVDAFPYELRDVALAIPGTYVRTVRGGGYDLCDGCSPLFGEWLDARRKAVAAAAKAAAAAQAVTP